MKNMKLWRTALVAALVLTVMLSVTGGTIAWFTDTAESDNNIIKSGNLDIELEYWNGTDWNDVKDSSDILTGDLWEPGYVDVAYLRLKNAGSLALKYQLGVNIVSETAGVNKAGESFNLSDYICFDVAENVNGEESEYANREAAMAAATGTNKISAGYSKEGTLEASSDYAYLAVVVYMPTTVDNAANHNGTDVPQIDLGINVIATQHTLENDSFGSDYDEDATYVPLITTLAELREALAAGGSYALGADIVVNQADMLYAADGGHSDGSAFFIKADTVLDLNGHNITVNSGNVYADVFFMKWSSALTIIGDGDLTADCSMACVYDANSVLNVEGGNFTITADNDMLYSVDGKINVNGGTFTTSYWNTINIYGKGRVGLVDVTGGSFEGWNPASSPDGNLVAEGYTVTSEVIDGVTWYTVVAES